MAQSPQDMAAHLIVLRGEVEEQTQKVNQLIDEGARIRESNTNMIEKGREVLQQIHEEAAQVQNQSVRTTEELTKREEAISLTERDLKEKVEAVNQLFIETKKRVSEIVIEAKDEVIELQEQRDNLKEEIVDINVSLTETNESLKEISRQKDLSHESYEELRELIIQKQEVLKTILEEVDAMSKYYSELQIAVQKESVKTREANGALALREDAITKRERNLQIIKGRIEKVFALLYPDQSIDNLI